MLQFEFSLDSKMPCILRPDTLDHEIREKLRSVDTPANNKELKQLEELTERIVKESANNARTLLYDDY